MTDQVTLPTPDEAFSYLSTKVANEVFFNRLAAYGIQPQNEKEASQLLDLAAKLQTVEHQVAEKQASAGQFSDATQALDRLLGVEVQQKTAEESRAFSQLASAALEDPDIFNSVLVLKQAQADLAAQQAGYSFE